MTPFPRRPSVDDERDRAQLILVSALALATTLVALSLVVNSVIYTENLATRRDADTGQALNFREATHDGALRGLETANFEPADATYLQRKAALRDSLAGWQTDSSRYFASQGLEVATSAASFVEGTRVSQDTVGPFDPATDDVFYENNELDPLGIGVHDTWLAVDEANVRRLRMDVERSGPLYETGTDPMTASIKTLYDGNDVYSLNVEDASGDRWWVVVYEDTSTSPTTVGVATYEAEDDESFEDGDWTTSDPCLVDADTVTLDVTGGTVQGDGAPVACEALEFWADEDFEGPVDLTHTEGDQISGTYSFFVDDPEGTFRSDVESRNDGDLYSDIDYYVTTILNLGSPTITEDDSYVSSPGSGVPYTNPAIYATDVTVEYRTGGLVYESSVRVAPGEPGETTGPAGGGGGGDSGSDSNTAPDAQFSVSDTTVTVGDPISFDASASTDSDGSIPSDAYEWAFGDGNVDTGATASHPFGSAGSYDVTLTVTDDDGATDSRTRTVQVVGTGSNPPQFTSTSLDDQSVADGGAGNNEDRLDFVVDWSVEDTDGDLSEVRLELVQTSSGKNRGFIDSASAAVGGTSADSSLSVGGDLKKACDETYELTLTVQDGETQTATETWTGVTASC
jgi:chitodextrinase